MSKPDPELQALIHEIDVHRAQLPLVLELADIAIKHSQEESERIEQSMAESDVEIEEARQVLRTAGLLRD